MSNTDEKILQALENLQADITALRDGQKSLEAGQRTLGAGQKTLETRQLALEQGQKTLTSGLQALELKVEAIHNYQKKAHNEIMGHLVDTTEMSDRDHKALEKRVERIEKHVNLPPVK